MQGLRAVALGALVALAVPVSAGAQDWPATEEAGGVPGTTTVTSDRFWSGDHTYSFRNVCRAGFLLTDGTEYYTFQPAHCSFQGGGLQLDGCDPLPANRGDHVDIDPYVYRIGPYTWTGRVVYNSWLEMERNGEADPDTCRHNDFALVRVDVRSDDWVPSVPVRGGPRGMTSSVDLLEDVYGIDRQKALGERAGGWSLAVPNPGGVDTIGPGFGETGTPYMDSDGAAFGYLRWPGQVTSLTRALAYMKQHTDAFDGVALVDGVDPFVPDALP